MIPSQGSVGASGDLAPLAHMAATMLGEGEICLLYTSDAADERSSVDLGGRRIIKKKKRIILGRRRNV